jgi:hypothetical protein
MTPPFSCERRRNDVGLQALVNVSLPEVPGVSFQLIQACHQPANAASAWITNYANMLFMHDTSVNC